jgi:hypothetical protein
MELFSHINEVGSAGWESLRTVVLTCPRVVLWAPSASRMALCRHGNRLLPTPSELLWYVEEGHVQILAREWWIADRNEREKAAKERFKHARWSEQFDGRVLEIWHEERELGRTGTSAKVRTAPPETGAKWAEEQISADRIDCQKAVANLDNKKFPAGYLEKIKGLGPRDAVKSLLRDAHNHGLAFRESGADRNLGSPADEYFLEVFAEGAVAPGRDVLSKTEPIPRADKIVEGINFVFNRIRHSVKPPRSQQEAFERTQKLLGDKGELNELRLWAVRLDGLASTVMDPSSQVELSHELARELKRGTAYRSFIDYFKPHTPADWARLSFELLVASIQHSGAISFVAEPAIGLLRWLGWLGEEFQGPRWPFYLAEGNKSVRRKTREAIIQKLSA